MIYISLATIPSRQKTLDDVIASISSQTVPADRIILNICDEYVRFPGEYMDPTRLQTLSRRFPTLFVNFTADNGPATKLLGFLEAFGEAMTEKDTLIILDDDFIYHHKTVERLTNGVETIAAFNYFNNRDFTETPDPHAHPVRPCLPGYLGYSINGKYAMKLYAFARECVEEFPVCRFDDDAIVSRFVRKNGIKINWKQCLQWSHTSDEAHNSQSALWMQPECTDVRNRAVEYLCTK